MTKEKTKLTDQKVKAFLATDDPPRALREAGWTPRDLREAGWTPRDLREAGWTPRDLMEAGWPPRDLEAAEKDWASIPIIPKIYTRLLAEIEAGKRKHDQSKFGPDSPPEHICKTPMCTAGHLVNLAGEDGYKLKAKYDWKGAARMIHMKNRPDVPPQNFGAIPQEFAMAYIRERAQEENQK